MLNPKLVATLPCGANLRNPYTPPHSISFPHVGQIPAIVLPVPSPSFSPVHLLSVRNPCTSTPARSPLYTTRVPLAWHLLPLLSPLRTWVGLLLIQFLLRCSSPLRAQVRFPPTRLSLPCPSSLRAWVGFPSTRFLLPCPSPLCAWVGLLSTRFSFTILYCKYLSVKSSMCMNLMQVGRAQFQRLKGARTSLVWTSCSSFSTAKGAKGVHNLVVWFFYFDVPLPSRRSCASQLMTRYACQNTTTLPCRILNQ